MRICCLPFAASSNLGNPLFRAEVTPVGKNRSFCGIVDQKKYKLTLQQLRDAQDEPLGEAITEALIQGLQRVVENEGLNVPDYSLLVAVHSNSFTHVWSQSARNVPLEEWLSNGAYTRAWLEDLAKKLNSAQVMDPQRDGFYVELTFVKRLGRGGKNGGKKANPGRHAWEKLAKKKRSVVTIQNKDNLCLARATLTMKERVDNGSQYQNLRKGRPIQERLAKMLHREAGVPRGPCGFEELEKFQDFLGPQGYQLIVVEPSKCLIVFKEAKYNNTPHVISLVKHQDHFDGLTSIPALSIVPITVVCVMMSRVPPTTIVVDKTALPVFEQIRPAQIMLRGSSQPLNVQTATANVMAKIVLKPTKRKERRKTTKAFVKAGENV